MNQKTNEHQLRQLLWFSGIALALMGLPLLLLLPIGAYWLWQQGWLLFWVLASLGVTLVGSACLAWSKRRLHQDDSKAEPSEQAEAISPASEGWSALDNTAWEGVVRLARAAEPDVLTRQSVWLSSTRAVIEQVARHYHPEQNAAIWQFTLPELFLLTERVSQRVRKVVLEQVPASHLVRVGQVVRIWELKTRFEPAYRTAHGIYRLVRWVNPLSALVAEARGALMDQMLGAANQNVRQTLARIWIEEVGRAAIDLYSGRLTLDAQQLEAMLEAERQASVPPGPVRIQVAGQVNVGKSSLINALLQETRAEVDALPVSTRGQTYQLTLEGEPVAELRDAPGLTTETDLTDWAKHSLEADCLIWVVAAHRADRDLDRRALRALHELYRANPQRSRPPILVAVSHVDRLSPAREWQPPYNLLTRSQPKAQSIHAALEQIAADLELSEEDLIPVRLDQGSGGYNLELFWAVVLAHLDSARHNRTQRLLQQGLVRKDWKPLLRQARGAGRWLGAAMKAGPKTR
ncbi:MAG: GTPase family protein [Saccharospirillum sp.]